MKRKTGSPTGRETQGDAAPIVRVGVPPDQGERESRPQGKGWQGKDDKPPGHAVRDARRQEGRCVQTREPDAGKLARPVRGREDGKVLFSNSPASYPGAGSNVAETIRSLLDPTPWGTRVVKRLWTGCRTSDGGDAG